MIPGVGRVCPQWGKGLNFYIGINKKNLFKIQLTKKAVTCVEAALKRFDPQILGSHFGSCVVWKLCVIYDFYFLIPFLQCQIN